ncbi:Glycosyl transferase family 39 OS=Thermodesulfatator indicus (strain DSM 15286 / JCM 11887 / CIR29812) GN=Thein_2028 PE=4 SV=1: PMT_2 [Gemmataceae bacterium]|nr:Glycosyl transferase family 39 OS=Thermodesulfatator indicus (strain DSM 15286 / JCM 11887 / CIR29812) GN=Thein_2028 PE=4 SV=1: PMT_2 [Gemmataceae bacterium]VTT98397.1 Glycosyl transferase family 39 OS=Thermodesulfatator indicus (strain DSM 15286 / JCM 11887 / CIR29812) GN=Thein_2028 PE=4 SV=1: PMT_2 [Gemmataceae bacterium]
MRLARELTSALVRHSPARAAFAACWFPTAVGLYLLLVAGLRTLVARSLMFDESEQLALSQVLALGYGTQPPLLIWAAWCAVAVFGVSSSTILGLRFVVLGLMYAGLYSCGRSLGGSCHRAALAAAAALLVPALSWDFVLDKTNTPAACAMAAFAVAALVNAVGTGSRRAAVSVGLIVALGILSKYTFVPFVAGLVSAALTVPEYRQWALSRRGAVAALTALGVILPHAVWVVANRAELADGITHSITDRPERTLGRLVLSAVDVAVMSFGVTLLAFAWLASQVFRRGSERPAQRLLGRALVMAGVAAIAVVVLAGGTRFKPHWFTPLAVLLPAYLVSRLGETPDASRAARRLGAVLGVLVVGVAVLAGAVGTTDWLRQGLELRQRDRIAAEVASAVPAHASLVCESLRDAGNLRHAHPRSAIAVLGTPESARPTLLDGAVLVWDASRSDAVPETTAESLARDHGLRPDPTAAVRFVGEAITRDNPRARRLGVVRLTRD